MKKKKPKTKTRTFRLKESTIKGLNKEKGKKVSLNEFVSNLLDGYIEKIALTK